ncbi:MAG: Bug family tripartite tricarboxylate transporter substrate binding protein [Burkholderiales bacterium]
MRPSAVPLLLAAVVASGLVHFAHAQPYPTKPIRMIVPFPAGSASDSLTRAISQELVKTWEHGFVVDNRPGASTIIGAEACARSAPDGYTLCMVSIDNMSIMPVLHKKLPFDPAKDFEPIMRLVTFVQGLAVAATLPVSSLKELIALATEKPGVLNYGSLGQGSNSHLFFEWFARARGVNLTHVPYKGVPPVIQAVTVNEVQIVNLAVANLIPHHRAGKLKILAVDGTRRSAQLPDIPTFPEAGIPPTGFVGWLGFAGPAGIPKDVVTRVHAEIAKIFASDAFREKFIINLGMTPSADTPEEFARFLKQDREAAAELVRQSGVRLD